MGNHRTFLDGQRLRSTIRRLHIKEDAAHHREQYDEDQKDAVRQIAKQDDEQQDDKH